MAPDTNKRLEILLEGKKEILLRLHDVSTNIRVGEYPSNSGEMYVITSNGTWISIDPSGRIRIDIPPKHLAMPDADDEPCAAVIARRLRDAEDERAAYAANARENDYESLPRNRCTKKGR